MMKFVSKLTKGINIFSLVCIGAYTAVAIEYGLDTTIAAGIVFSTILAILTFFIERKAIEK